MELIAVYSPPTPLAPNRQAVINNAVAVLNAQGASVRILAVSDIPLQPGSCVSYPLPPVPPPPAVRCSSVPGKIHEDGEFADVGATVSTWLGGKQPGRRVPGTPILTP